MKRLTNILSYLWLLLLMAVTACSDMEDETGPMQMEEEVELTIHTELSGMKGSTRTVPTESITAITAYAFDSNSQLIKVVKAKLSDTQATSGALKIKVPKRTGDIHFIAKNNAETPDVTINIGDNVSTLLTQTTTDLHYWGKATYNGSNNLSVTLHRNMAKLTLTKGEGFTANSCYIAGFVNRNKSGTIVPSGYIVGETPTIPTDVETNTHQADNSLGSVYYLFEHANTENNPLYVIIEVAAKYYKVAFAAGDEYFPIIRNHEYTITVDGIDAMYAENNYTDAVDSQYPINDLVITNVPMTVTASPTEVLNQSGQTFTVTVTIPEGITELNVPTHDAFDITPPNSLTPQNGKYTVTQGDYEFTFTVNEGVEAGDKTISFSGRGKYKSATGSATVTLEDKKTVSIEAVPSATTLNYAASSVEDLLVNVTIQKEVTKLSFSSDDFTIKVASGELVAVENEENSYTIKHAENATETTIPVRIRLNDGVDKETASFTFNGTSDDANVEVQSVTKKIALTADGDENVRWQGNVPLSSDNDSIMVPLLYNWFCKSGTANIPINSRLQFEFDVTSDSESYFEITEIRGSSNEWNNPAFSFPELANGYRYNAITSGEGQVIVTMNQDVFDIILENYQSSFLGDTDVAMAIRGTGITLTKVSVLPPAEVTPTVAITATPYVNSLNYSTNSESDLIVNVTIPKEVSTLTFASEYFDAAVVVDTLLTAPTNGTYTVVHPNNGNDPTSTSVRLRLKNKTSTTSAGFTFSGTGENVTVTSAVIDNITLTEGGDEYVRWQGDAALQWGINAVQIPLLYSWFYDANNQLIIPVGSTLRVEYENLGNDASIQFAECNGTWNDDAYYFSELHAEYNNNGNNETMGLNLDNNTGIYNGTSKDLVLTQAVLDNMKENRTNLLGENDIVMAIQGGNVTLKKISVIPNNQADNNQLDIKLDFYPNEDRDDNDFSNLVLGESKLTLEVTIPVEDSRTYAGTVQLKGAFSSSNPYANANGAIHWDNSRDKNSSTISYGSGDQNGTVLEFTIVEGQTSYKIDWVFTTGSHYPGYGDIAFTYTISNVDGNSYNIYGDTNASIAFTNEPVGIVLLNSQHQFETQDNGYWTSLTFEGPFPIGTKIILTFSEGGGIKLCDGSNNNLYVPAFASENLYGNGGNSDLWMTAPTGNLVLDITEDIILYGKGTGTNNGNLSANNPLNSFIIESGETVLDKVVVVYPEGYVEEEEVIFNINFDNGSMENLSVVFHQDNGSQGTFDSTGGSLALNISSPGTDNWHAQITRAVSFEQNVTYKLTCKVKSTVSGNMVIWFDDPDNSHAVRVDNPPTVGLTVSNDFVNVEVYITPNQTDQTGRFVINFGLIPQGTIYIDDLKLVKKLD